MFSKYVKHAIYRITKYFCNRIMCSYQVIDIFLYGRMVTGIDGVKIIRVVDIVPHVVVLLDMIIEALHVYN